jgi:hypothetical protein
MSGLLAQITLVNILSVLLLIASVWLLVIIIQKRIGYMFRGMMFFLFVLLALIYFQQSDAKKYTLSDVRYALFPKKGLTLNYYVDEDSQGAIVRYIFEDPKPRIPVSMDSNGKYFHIKNITVINEILDRLRLPRITKGAQELALITGSISHVNLYRWDDYPLGVLIIERTLCRNKETLDTFNCLAAITVRKKYRN